MSQTPLSADQLIAHRGQTLQFPENTLPALYAAAQAGATAVEIDLQCSADGIALLFHDVNLRRVCGVGGRIYKRTRNELAALSAHEPRRFDQQFINTPIPDLEDLRDFLTQHPHIQCFVEMKPQSVERFGAEHCAGQLQQILAPVLPQCTFISFDEDFVQHMLHHKQKTGLIIRRRRQLSQLNPALAVCFCNVKRLRRSDDIKALPVPLAVYEVNDIPQAHDWLQRGARWIESHNIAGLLEPADNTVSGVVKHHKPKT